MSLGGVCAGEIPSQISRGREWSRNQSSTAIKTNHLLDMEWRVPEFNRKIRSHNTPLYCSFIYHLRWRVQHCNCNLSFFCLSSFLPRVFPSLLSAIIKSRMSLIRELIEPLCHKKYFIDQRNTSRSRVSTKRERRRSLEQDYLTTGCFSRFSSFSSELLTKPQ